MKQNLLEETLEILKDHDLSSDDVRFVTDGDSWMTWDKFKELADFEYEESYGDIEVNELLKIVGDDWWLDRREYDTREWWEHNKIPVRPKKEGEVRLKNELRDYKKY